MITFPYLDFLRIKSQVVCILSTKSDRLSERALRTNQTDDCAMKRDLVIQCCSL